MLAFAGCASGRRGCLCLVWVVSRAADVREDRVDYSGSGRAVFVARGGAKDGNCVRRHRPTQMLVRRLEMVIGMQDESVLMWHDFDTLPL